MKKIIISMLLCCLFTFGCNNNKSTKQMAEEKIYTEETQKENKDTTAIVSELKVDTAWTETFSETYDFNHNGKTEILILSGNDACLNGAEDYELTFYEDGEKIYIEYAGETHAAWNTLFAIKIDGLDYLLRYNPYIGTGCGEYRYRIFSLNESGEEEILKSNYVDFDLSFISEFEPSHIASFVEEVHSWLTEESVLLITTENSHLRTQESGATFDDDDFWSDTYYDDTKSLEENLMMYESIMRAVYAEVK